MSEESPDQTIRRRAYSWRQVGVVGLTALVFGGLLNSAGLLETARRQPLGTLNRNFAIAVMEPVERLSEAVYLTGPRQALDAILGRSASHVGDSAPGREAAGSDEPMASGGAAPVEPVEPLPSGEPSLPASAASTSTTMARSSPDLPVDDEPEPLPQRRVPTLEEPLVVWVIGDSFVELFGPALRNDSFETGVITTVVDFRFISGLVRPDYYDWPARVRQRMPEVTPDVVVVLFGGNDGQKMSIDGRIVQAATPEWTEAYRVIVGEFMDLLLDEGAAHVYWVGLPIMRSATFTEKVKVMNGAYRGEAESRDAVTYISSFELFMDDRGEYSTYLTDANGRRQLMRSSDGAHLQWPGAYRLSSLVLEVIANDWAVVVGE